MSKKLLALLLAVIMLVGLVPMTVMADGETPPVAKIGETEYATLAEAIKAAEDMETKEDVIITLLPAYDQYPQAWVTPCKNPRDGLTTSYTFHAFNPDNGDEAIFDILLKDLFDPFEAGDFISKGPDEDALEKIKAKILDNRGELEEKQQERMAALAAELGLDLTTFKYDESTSLLGWRADYEVTFTKDGKPAGADSEDFALADQYEMFGTDWIDYKPFDLGEGESKQLLADMLPSSESVLFDYRTMLLGVNKFGCGFINRNPVANSGKTFNVKLYLYDPAEDHENVKILIKETNYTCETVEVEPEVEVDVPKNASAIDLTESTVEQEDVAAVQTEVKTLLEQTGTQNETADTKKSLEAALKATVENNATALVIINALKKAAEEQGLGEDVINAIADNAITEKKLEIKFNKVEVKEVEEQKATLNSISYNVTPVVVAMVDGEKIRTEIHDLAEEVTFRLAVNFAKGADVLVFDDGKLLEGEHKVEADKEGNTYVDISSKTFSEFTIVGAIPLDRKTSKEVGLYFESAALTVADALDLKFTVVADDYTDVVVKAYVGGKEQTCKTVVEKDKTGKKITKYIVEVSPEYIKDDVQLQLYGTKGDVRYGTTYKYSVEKYCMNQLEKFAKAEEGKGDINFAIKSKEELEAEGIMFYSDLGEEIVVRPEFLDTAKGEIIKACQQCTCYIDDFGTCVDNYLKEIEAKNLSEHGNIGTIEEVEFTIPENFKVAYEARFKEVYIKNEKLIALKALLNNILKYGEVAANTPEVECNSELENYDVDFYKLRGKDLEVAQGIKLDYNCNFATATLTLSNTVNVEFCFTQATEIDLSKAKATAKFNKVEPEYSLNEYQKEEKTESYWDTIKDKDDETGHILGDYTGREATDITGTIEFVGDNGYRVVFKGINASEIDDDITYTIINGEQDVLTVTTSVYYLLEIISGELPKAVINYGLAADYYAYIINQ